MRKIYERIVAYPRLILIVFAIFTLISACCKPLVAVNYDMNDYLPRQSRSTVSLELLQSEFSGGIPNARVMIKNVSIPQALQYKEQLLAVPGVTGVMWLDDAADITIPLAALDQDKIELYYKDNTAIFSLTIESEKRIEATEKIRELIGEENAMSGSAVSTAAATASTVKEVGKIAVIAVLFVLFVLLLTTTSWVEPFVVLCGLGVAILLNAGTNLVFGEISFVTNAAGNILQLAVSLDYSVFLLHRFMECRKEHTDSKAAMADALCKSTASIFSSGLTTVIGFLALCLMHFGIGPDLGFALAKGIAISLITVFVFSPALILITYKWIQKTKHRPFMPGFQRFGTCVMKVTPVFILVFVLVLPVSYLASNSNDFYYGASNIFGENTKLGKDIAAIEDVFGKSDTYVLMVPRGDLPKEQALSNAIQELPEVTDIISYVDMVGSEIPLEYLDKDTLSQLMSETYSRLVISVNTDFEGKQTFALINQIRGIANDYYPEENYLAGEGVSTLDLMDTITGDMLKVNLLAIGAVFLVLVVTQKSVLLPTILVLCIETAVWINLSIPYFRSSVIFYIAYLIISSVQLGATVDYAILMTDRFKELRLTYDRKDAIVNTVGSVTLSILTSGITLTAVGFLLGIISTHGLLSQLGYFLGIGTICSLLIVLFVLPGLLSLYDRLQNIKLKNADRRKKIMTSIHEGLKKKWAAKRTAAMFLAVALLCTNSISAPAFAAADIPPKQEVVYINLNSDGSVDNVYVVNIFELREDGTIIDYGNYTALRNMTANDEIVFHDETITIDAKAGKLYYEGILDSDIIPWNFSLRYFLDGTEYSADEIAGKSGALKIAMSVRENTACNSPFFDNYALQASFTLDTKLCANISAENATAANVGRKKQLTYTILPGKETDAVITADVTDFEMEGIAINGVPLSMNLDVNIDESEELNELTNGASELDDGAAQLKGGAAELYDGTKKLIDGMRDLQSGGNELYDGANSLKSGADDLQGGAKGLNDGTSAILVGSNDLYQGSKELRIGANDLDDGLAILLQGGSELEKGIAAAQTGAFTLQNGAADLTGGATDVRDGVLGMSDGLQVLSSQNDALLDGAYTVFQQLTEQAEMQLNQNLGAMGFPAVTLTPENYNDVLNGLLAALSGDAILEAEPEEMPDVSIEMMTLATASNANYHVGNGETAILALQSQLNDYSNFYRGLQGYTNGVRSAASGSLSLVDGADRLLSGATNLQEGAKGMYDGLFVLKQGGSELVDGIYALQNGSAKLLDGTLVLENGTVQLYDGLVELSDGTKALMEGANELYDGTVTLSDGTVELKNGMAELLNGLIELQNGVITLHDGTIDLSDGTFKLRDRTSDLDVTMKDKITSTIDDMMCVGFEPVSFVSDKNTNVEFVQFVVKTDGIFKLETEAAAEVQNEPLTFWQKLLNLFVIS